MLVFERIFGFNSYYLFKDYFLIVIMLKKDIVISFSCMILKKVGNVGLIL